MRGRYALLSVLLLATGCGIRPTDVVQAGEPATVEVAPAGQLGTLLYFVSSSTASRLLPVIRPAEQDIATAREANRLKAAPGTLALLFAGPTRSERDAGLRSELPSGRPKASVELSPQGVKVNLDIPVTRLSHAARQQLICTAARARTADRTETVTVSGTDGVIGPDHCVV
ncbi:hypothetical protein OG242_27730 [Streptomyces sp. NBC_00727]|uniref:hypothetical protein n=1 Tax=Streptomyces sp. NBC_00727 TaxID=2903675 RepID=UPI00386773C8